MEWTEKIRLLDEDQQEHLSQMVDDLLAGNGIKKHTLYPIKDHYTVEDIQAIVKLFSPTKKWTCADLENEAIFPPNLLIRLQLLDYKLYIMRPTPKHQEILGTIYTYINLFVKQNNLGKTYPAPVAVHINEGNCLEPDIVLVLKKNVKKVTEKGIFEAPALVVEVISPANYKKLREAKKQKYADFGVEEYWEIYPTKKEIKVEVLDTTAEKPTYVLFSKAEKQGKIQSKVLEGFELNLGEVFE